MAVAFFYHNMIFLKYFLHFDPGGWKLILDVGTLVIFKFLLFQKPQKMGVLTATGTPQSPLPVLTKTSNLVVWMGAPGRQIGYLGIAIFLNTIFVIW